MTVETDLDREQYATNATTGPWTVNFYFLANEELSVTYTDANDVDTLLALDVDYSVVGAGDPDGGTVATTQAYAAGGQIVILRDVAFLQETEYVDGDSFPAKTHERALDRLTMIAQQLREMFGRAITFPASFSGNTGVGDVATRRGKLLGFDAITGAINWITAASGSALELAASLAGSAGSTLVTFQLMASALVRSAQSKMGEFVHASDFPGYDKTGVADSYAALIAADTYARSVGKPLYISGTPRIKSQVNLTSKTHWIFQGGAGVAAGNLPSSYLIKDASMTTAALVMSTDGIVFEGGGIVADVGNTGDNFQILGNSCEWLRAPYLYRAGQDNLRIGRDTAGANANGFRIESPRCQSAGRDNIHIDDASVNANAGLISRPLCQNAGRAAVYFNRADLGNVIMAPIFENNLYGLYFDTLANRNVILGGDIEANGTNVYYANKLTQLRQRLVNTTVQGVNTSTDHATQAWSTPPTIYGATAAGTATYTQQLAVQTFNNGLLNFSLQLTWSSFTGTGQSYIDLPDLTGYGISTLVPGAIPVFLPVNAVAAFTLAAGAQLVALVNTSTYPPRLQFYTSNAGAVVAYTLPASGAVYVGGQVPIVQY